MGLREGVASDGRGTTVGGQAVVLYPPPGYKSGSSQAPASKGMKGPQRKAALWCCTVFSEDILHSVPIG